MTDRELLEKLYTFIVQRQIITGDRDSIMDMVKRYKNPPLTMHHQHAMLMSKTDYARLENMLGEVLDRLKPVELGGKPEMNPAEIEMVNEPV